MIRNAALASRLLNRPLALLPAHGALLLDMLRSDAPPAALFGEDSDRDRRDRPYQLLDNVAVIPIRGCLVHGVDWYYWGMQSSYDRIRGAFVQALDDDMVQAIALHFDSPGGECCGCFDLVDTIFQARKVKPVHAIVDEACYSAAYALASAADRIVTPRTGGMGSIGIIWQHTSFAGALEQAGLEITTLTYGSRKADGNPAVKISDAARERAQADIDTLGELFTDTVARNRGLAASKIRGMQAGTFLGGAAVNAGLADDVMPAESAIAALLALVA